MNHPWTYDEEQIQAVTDYHSLEEVAHYDARMRTVRNVAEENQTLKRWLEETLPEGLTSWTKILEIGTGTGAFARFMAPYCYKIIAADVSQTMLQWAANEAKKEGLSNIEWQLEGFLSFQAKPESLDAVVSSLALHHLNDVWKAEAVHRIFQSVKPGGIFLLVDVIFDCEGGELDAYLQKFIPETMNPEMKQALFGHIRTECSTFRWMMEDILRRAGWNILHCERFGMMAHLMVCRKPF